MKFDELVNKIAEFEGFCAHTYQDIGGTLTIGYGFTAEKYTSMKTISKEQADIILTELVKNTYTKVKSVLNMYGYNCTENQILALTSFTYNLGLSNLEKLLKYGTRNIGEISLSIPLYNKCNGKVLNGLVKRRKWEQELFNATDLVTNPTNIDIQKLCNAIINEKSLPLTQLSEDNCIGIKTRRVIYSILKLYEKE